MTSLYEHSQPEGCNAKLICVFKLLSQADVSELHCLCIQLAFMERLYENIFM